MKANKNYKEFVVIFFSLLLLSWGTFISYIFIFDPWQLFHKPWFRPIRFIANSRFQDAGIINSYNFDSVILGTSTSQNFSINNASKLFESTFVNLSIEGSLLSERAIVLKRVLEKQKIKLVICSLDFQPEFAVGIYNASVPRDTYDFLYNNNRIDDLRLYFNLNLASCWNLDNKCNGILPGKRISSLEELYHWKSSYGASRGLFGIDGWCSAIRDFKSKYIKSWVDVTINIADRIKDGSFPAKEKLDSRFEENLRSTLGAYLDPLIKDNPSVKFYLFFPPYSRLRYALLRQGYYSVYDLYIQHVEYIVNKFSSYGNVTIFGFENEPFLDDLINYDDVFHYREDTSTQLLQWMAEGSHMITPDNLSEYLHNITMLAEKYDVLSVASAFQECQVR